MTITGASKTPRQVCAGALSLSLVLVCALTSRAGVVALHEDANDPVTEAWTRFRDFDDVATFAVVNDISTGIDAWAVDDNSGIGNGTYGHDLTAQELADAAAFGWKLTARLRVVDIGAASDAVVAIFNPGAGTSFKMQFGREADGSPLVALAGDVVDLDDLGSGYHKYELVFDPVSGDADLFVDSVLRFSGFQGDSIGPKEAHVRFGTVLEGGTGQGNWNLVKFETIPEPSSFVTSTLGLLGLLAYRRRRCRPHKPYSALPRSTRSRQSVQALSGSAQRGACQRRNCCWWLSE